LISDGFDADMKKPGIKPGFVFRNNRCCGQLLDFLMERVTLEMRIVFLFLDTLRHGFLVPEGEVTGDGFALFLGFSAFQGDEFLHGSK
jgi:hypothetical protein